MLSVRDMTSAHHAVGTTLSRETEDWYDLMNAASALLLMEHQFEQLVDDGDGSMADTPEGATAEGAWGAMRENLIWVVRSGDRATMADVRERLHRAWQEAGLILRLLERAEA
jgi:hypothetical protein